MSTLSILGGGIAGLTAASSLAKAGHQVDLIDNNVRVGGRISSFSKNGFLFDKGPSWYWMPDVFERFFNEFSRTQTDFYDLKQLDPGFKIFYEGGNTLMVPSNREALYEVFEEIEKGSAAQLKLFLEDAEIKYNLSMSDLVYNPSLSWFEFVNKRTIEGVIKNKIFQSFDKHVRKYFKDDRLIQLMEFPVLFLGAKPSNIPSLYSLMNHAALNQGTFYPMGGMIKIAEAFEQIAREQGVQVHCGETVQSIEIKNGQVHEISTNHHKHRTDGVVVGMDYHHFEQNILEQGWRNYDEAYWDKRTLSPSSLIFFLGIDKKLPHLEHHNLFFDTDFKKHAEEIYDTKEWPSDPLFYVCCPSKTDATVAPEGSENLFILIPIAPGIVDTEFVRKKYLEMVLIRMEKICKTSIKENIIVQESYCIKEFKEEYNSYKGNAYGLANTYMQTAVLKPSMINPKIKNMVYAGQLTVPGPGLPPAIISGQIASALLLKQLKKT